MKDELLEKIRKMRETKNCHEISMILRVPARQIERWTKGQTQISPAYREIVKQNLEGKK